MATIGVFAALFDDQGRMGLVKQAYRPYRWTQPGGRLEQGESPCEAVLRELREETGVEGVVEGVLGFYYARYKMDLVIMYKVRPIKFHSWAADEEIADFRFFGSGELPEPMAFNSRTRIKDAFEGRASHFTVFDTEETVRRASLMA